MVLPGLSETWLTRLARLRECVAVHPEGATWLWRMRIRILEYLVSRYACEPAHQDSDVPEFKLAQADLDEHTLSESARMAYPGDVAGACLVDAENPPRASGALALILHDLWLMNEASRFRTGIGPPPDAVWEWWRAEWCLAKASAACEESPGRAGG